MKVCSKEQMRQIDRKAWEDFGIPSIVLMENAALSCVYEVLDFSKFTVICGKGNNAGDGFAIARHLINKGKSVKVYLALGNDFSGDAQINYNSLCRMGADIIEYKDRESFSNNIKNCDCIIDALFGTGVSGNLNPTVLEIIDTINSQSKYTLSVDIPSGVDADSGEILSGAIKADKTVTFAAYKPGLLLYPGADYAGETVVADISIPEKLLENIKVSTIDEKFAKSVFPKRRKDAHKGDFGKILIIGGSLGMAGAVCLAASAAFKVGAGLVTVCVPREINDIVQISIPEAMTIPVDFKTDTDVIIDRLKDFDVILFGNGIGRENILIDLLEKVLKNAQCPVVIDGDGLYALSKNKNMLFDKKCDVILTPHSMEMARLIGESVDFVENNRFSICREFVFKYGVTLVLKGNHTIITAPDGAISINLTGNSGMATAGSGDALAGMIAQMTHHLSPWNAAKLCVFLHGAAGDFAALHITEYSVTASDIINSISHILPLEKDKMM